MLGIFSRSLSSWPRMDRSARMSTVGSLADRLGPHLTGASAGLVRESAAALHKIRDGYDVAHYDLDPKLVEQAESQYGRAVAIVKEVLSEYRRYAGHSDREGAA